MDTNQNGSERAGFGFQDGLPPHAWVSRAAQEIRGFTTTPIRVPSWFNGLDSAKTGRGGDRRSGGRVRLRPVVDVQPVGGGEAALNYLANFLCAPPLREHQLERDDAAGVTFRYRANGGEVKRAAVSGEEFVRRFLQHVLPKGFQRVRRYGWRGGQGKMGT